MKAGVVVLAALATSIANGYMSTDWPRGETMLNGRAKEIWQHYMTVVDRSVKFWKTKQPGTAPYAAEELTEAIDFERRSRRSEVQTQVSSVQYLTSNSRKSALNGNLGTEHTAIG
jgi:hypothetical protein